MGLRTPLERFAPLSTLVKPASGPLPCRGGVLTPPQSTTLVPHGPNMDYRQRGSPGAPAIHHWNRGGWLPKSLTDPGYTTKSGNHRPSRQHGVTSERPPENTHLWRKWQCALCSSDGQFPFPKNLTISPAVCKKTNGFRDLST